MRDISLGVEGGGMSENQDQNFPTANRAPLRVLAPTTNATTASSQSNSNINAPTQGRSGGMAGPQRVARAATPTRINRGQSMGYQDTGGQYVSMHNSFAPATALLWYLPVLSSKMHVKQKKDT